jgi:enoyl-CoA hydratase/carnithine racemase
MTVSVTHSTNGHIGEIQFAKPPLNFACPELLSKIADAIDMFDADREVRCIVLSSEGKSFCAGADLAGDESLNADDAMDSFGDIYGQARRIFARKKPMIAAIQGAAIGAGIGLALAADFRVAAPAARFSANFVRLGFHQGFAISVTLPRVVGQQRAAWMLLSAARIKPDDALAWGLADRLSGENDLMDVARAMAGEIAENAPLALRAVRKTMGDGFLDQIDAAIAHEHQQQALLKPTADYAEGVASVFERRAANFTGQ